MTKIKASPTVALWRSVSFFITPKKYSLDVCSLIAYSPKGEKDALCGEVFLPIHSIVHTRLQTKAWWQLYDL